MTAAPIPLLSPLDEFNRKAIENLHPSSWRNPIPGGRYNLVVLGGGTAGLVSAAAAGILGARVALVERHLLGGDCTNYGCVPSKALLRSARAVRETRHSSHFGVRHGEIDADFRDVMARMRSLRAQISANDSALRFQNFGVDVYFGEARFASPHQLAVQTGENTTRLEFKSAIIATGARPAVPPIPGLAEVGSFTNETIFSLEELPRRLIVLGAGPIGCELAQAFRRFGAEVTLIGRSPRLLPRDEPEATEVLRKQFEAEGICVLLESEAVLVTTSGQEKVVTYQHAGMCRQVRGDAILTALGRRPALETLGLEHAGVAFNAKGVLVNDHLRTSASHIYAAGDVCSEWKFTHAAEAMARLAVRNALFWGRQRMSSLVIPWCTYTDPEIAHVGIDHPTDSRRSSEIAVYTKELADTDRAVLDSDTAGYARLYVGRRSGRVLGATMVGQHAGDCIAEAVLAITTRQPVSALSGVIHPYPTVAEAWKRAADLHLQERLKPWLTTWLRRSFRWRR